MPAKPSLKKCFAAYGAKGKNPRWSWSARSDDGSVVVLALWSDRLRQEGDRLVYDCRGDRALTDFPDKPGNRERLENLRWARDNCGGRVRVVVVKADDPAATDRRIADCYPRQDLVLSLSELDERTGEFVAESI